jgi:glycosyltransferase involved in cell wall biosynthesis
MTRPHSEPASRPVVSVVTPTRNREGTLPALLSSLEAQTLGKDAFEVIVIDDGSTDGTQDVLARFADRGLLHLRPFRHDTSRGAAAAKNRGWREARGELIAFTDDDCEPVPEWLERIVAEADANPGQIIQGRVLPNPQEAEVAGVFSRSLRVEAVSPHYENANVLYPRAVLDALGGFDEAYPTTGGEDTDLSWRSRAHGVRCTFAPDALVYHAVHELGPIDMLRFALRATDTVRPYRDHPGMRQYLDMGVFYNRSHAYLLGVALAVVLARKSPATLAFAAPYAAQMVRRSRLEGRPLAAAPFFMLNDIVEMGATLRGAIRHRVFII